MLRLNREKPKHGAFLVLLVLRNILMGHSRTDLNLVGWIFIADQLVR